MAHPKTIPGQQWAPHPGPQTRFLACSADEALYGGQVGGGKSESLLLGATRFIHERSYKALILRRTRPEFESLWDRSFDFYLSIGGVPNRSKYFWRFPCATSRLGAKITFRSMEHEDDRLNFKSDEYQYIAFDELTSFTEKQFTYLLSRLRSSAGLPCFLRAGTNPGDVGHEWVLRRYAPWLYPPGEHTDEYPGPYAKAGEVLHFIQSSDGEDLLVPRGTPGALSRVFFPAALKDNPSVGGDYVNRLGALDRLSRKQLLGGDWMARAEPGEFFDEDWFLKNIVDRGPENLATLRVRYWDRAATEAEKKAKRQKSVRDTGPDWTVGALMSRSLDGKTFVEDVVRFRGGPAEVEKRIKETAERDQERFGDVRTVLEKDPGQAGKFEVDHYTRHTLKTFDVRAKPPQGDKISRAKPWSAQCEANNVRLVRGAWNRVFIAEHVMFPLGKKDQVDAASGGYAELANGVDMPPPPSGSGRAYARDQGGF